MELAAKVGMTVIAQDITHFNGTATHPAMITRVWGEPHGVGGEQATTVNITVFPDCSSPMMRGSVLFFRTKEEAERARLAGGALSGYCFPA